ncbi:MAG: DNA methyltransferase, partial [Longicatena sp.]
TNGNIVQGNACRVDWNEVCPHTEEEEILVFGNPPYLGGKLQNQEQKADMECVFSKFKKYKDLDYISVWFYLGAKYIKGSNAKSAFVSTNSICQGNQVVLLWKPIMDNNIKIFFAHHSFKWSNSAKHNAAVICVIIGMCNKNTKTRYSIYNNGNMQYVNNINPYLSSGSASLISIVSKPISILPKGSLGTVPKDDGHLILNQTEREELLSEYPELNLYIKNFVGSYDFINSHKRWILYIPDNVINTIRRISKIDNRLNKVSNFRHSSTEVSTRAIAQVPHKMFFDSYRETESIIIPRHSSERRLYIPIGYLSKECIIADSANTIPNAPLWTFGVITSEIHMIWVKTVAGRLKTDYRYSIQLVYNTFPFPKISEEKKKQIESAAEEVLLCREDYPDKTLADLYDPDKMPNNLRQAHHTLDLIVESCYQDKPFESDEERLECLFKLYEKMTKKEK